MKRIKETLWTDYDKVTKEIESSTDNNEKYKLDLEERDKVRNEIIKCEQMEIEAKTKAAQIESEERREKNRNRTTLITLGVTTGATLLGMWQTFAFDKNYTLTSTMGRSILNGLVPKIFRR